MDGVEMANLNMTLPWAGYQSLLFFQAGLDGGASHTLTFDALGKGEEEGKAPDEASKRELVVCQPLALLSILLLFPESIQTGGGCVYWY